MKQFLAFAIILLLFLMLLGAFGFLGNQVSPTVGTMVAHTQTATMWTPAPATPPATPVPNQAIIVTAFNDALRGADPLEEAMDAKFTVTDIGFGLNGNPPTATTIEIYVECEWITECSCTEQRAFVVLANAFKRVKPGIRKKIKDEIPLTIKTVRVRALNHMIPIGIIEIDWGYLWAFASGDITGDQLAARALQLSHP